ncbi:MAG: hypothetical protein ACK5LV_07980 [Lachnospirales bacterium]
MKIYKNSFKIGSLIVSIILGAGFLSGKELIRFFGDFRFWGIIGIFLSSLLIGIIAYSVMKIRNRFSITTIDEFFTVIFNGNKFLGVLLSIGITLFMFIIFATMTSAFCELLSEHFHIKTAHSMIVFALITFIFVYYGIDFLINLSTIMSIFMFFGCILIFIQYFVDGQEVFNNTRISMLYANTVSYTAYNILTTISLLVTGTHILKNKKEFALASFLGGFGVFIVGLSLFIPLTFEYSLLQDKALPIYHLLSNLQNNTSFTLLYVFIFLIAIISTGVSSFFASITAISVKPTPILTITVLILGLYASTLGFSNFVEIVYPLFSFIGIIEIYFILNLAIKVK